MSRIWYVGDSYVDPQYVGHREHRGETSWIQALPQALGTDKPVRNFACAGSSPDWAIQQLCQHRHLWDTAQEDYLLVSISDFSRLNLQSIGTKDQHSVWKHSKGKHVFREIHNSTWDYARMTATLAWFAGIAPYWRRVMVLTPFGIERCGPNFSESDAAKDALQMIQWIGADNFWWYPRFLFSYDKMYHQKERVIDGRPNHMDPKKSNSLLKSATEFFLTGEKNIYKPYAKMRVKENGI